MSWRDRDWAQFSEDERNHFFGGGGRISLRAVVWSALGVAVVAVVASTYVVRLPGLIPTNSLPGEPAPRADAHVVYSGPTGDNGHLACTAQSANLELDAWVCTEWTIVRAGQTAVQATDPGGRCKVRHVSQSAGRWVCDVPIVSPGPTI